MLYTTRGIVIHQLRYSESSLIVKIFTEQFGLRSYIFKGVFKPRSKNPVSLFQHLTMVELVADQRAYGGLQHPREIRIETPYRSLHTDILKSSVCLFLNEVLQHLLKHEEYDQGLFDFLHENLIAMDNMDKAPVDFHLWMMVRLTKFLGIYPKSPAEVPSCFDLIEGQFFAPTQQWKEGRMSVPCTAYFVRLMEMDPYLLTAETPNKQLRNELLDAMMHYYRFHIEDFGEIRSRKVLNEIFA